MCHMYFITVVLFLLSITGNVSSYEPEQNCDDQLRSNYFIPGLKKKLHLATEINFESRWRNVMDHLKSKLCRLSVAYGEALNITDYKDLPYTITKLGYVELLNIFKANGFSVRVRFDRTHSIIHTAAVNGKTDECYFLITHEASIGVKTPKWGYAPLHSSAINEKLDCIKLLIAFGAWLNPQTYEGNTPLHLAAQKGNVDIVKQLIRHKSCDQTIKNNYGKTAYDTARDYGHQLVAELLSSN